MEQKHLRKISKARGDDPSKQCLPDSTGLMQSELTETLAACLRTQVQARCVPAVRWETGHGDSLLTKKLFVFDTCCQMEN